MKKVEAIIRPERVTVVRKALEEIGFGGITITEVKGHGVQRGIQQQWRGTTFTIDLLPKVKIEMVVTDNMLERVLAAVEEHAKTGEIGDGKIFVSTIEEVVRVRTGERGERAV